MERLTERDWMNLASHGFPVHLYAERARAGKPPSPKGDTVVLVEAIDETNTLITWENEDEVKGVACEAHKAERAEKNQDALTQLADQIPR